MGKNTKIAYAVALALGTIAGAQATSAATPTVAQCKTPNETLFVAGSSAAQGGFGNALNTDAFGGAGITFSATNGNFKAYCGISANTHVAPIGDVVVVHYRAEGGSVVGALPIVSGKPIKFLDLTNAAVTGTTVTTGGTSGTSGTTDAWTGPLTEHTVEVGVTDVEPGQFVVANYPSSYSTAVFGSASPSQLAGLTKTVLFDQVFGLFVNTTGFNGGGSGQAVNLGRSTVANILTGTYTDWSQVPNSTTTPGSTVSSTAAPIVVVNREAGSGTRTGASIYFLNYNCPQQSTPIAETGAPDGYQTADVLTTAESTPGAITYASIDNAGKPNLTTVSLSGIAPSNFAPVSGQYDWWYEAQLIKGTIVSTGGTPIYTFLTTELSNVNTAPHQTDILAVPTSFNPGNPSPNTNEPGAAIYVNPFTRNSNSCSYAKAP
jgi:hypothetical protein